MDTVFIGAYSMRPTPRTLIDEFVRFSEEHGFAKPNDERALQLMDRAACEVMGSQEYKSHILLAFGESDEFR
jgi:tRNA(His) 5'-end guanylyltransferase